MALSLPLIPHFLQKHRLLLLPFFSRWAPLTLHHLLSVLLLPLHKLNPKIHNKWRREFLLLRIHSLNLSPYLPLTSYLVIEFVDHWLKVTPLRLWLWLILSQLPVMRLLKLFQLLQERPFLFFELKLLVFKFQLIHLSRRQQQLFILCQLVNLGFK